jgi:hypothetical protein
MRSKVGQVVMSVISCLPTAKHRLPSARIEPAGVSSGRAIVLPQRSSTDRNLSLSLVGD